MAKFVNYKKRDINLPEGCTDLHDVITLHSQQKINAAITRAKAATASSKQSAVQRNESIPGTLAEIGKYIEMVFASRGQSFTLGINCPGAEFTLGVCRIKGVDSWASVTIQKDSIQESAVRDYFTGRGLKMPEDSETPPNFFLPDVPVHLICDISSPLTDKAELSEVITDLFREVCGAKEDTKLLFHCMETGDAASPTP